MVEFQSPATTHSFGREGRKANKWLKMSALTGGKPQPQVVWVYKRRTEVGTEQDAKTSQRTALIAEKGGAGEQLIAPLARSNFCLTDGDVRKVENLQQESMGLERESPVTNFRPPRRLH